MIIKEICLILLSFNVLTQLHAQSHGGRITTIEWAPNGKAMVLSIMKVDPSGKPISPTKAYWFNLKKKTLDLLYENGGAGTVSPDGKKIAFARRKENGKSDIFLYDRISKKESGLVIDTVRLFGPSWSSDGKKIALNWQIGRGAPVQIYIVDVKTKYLTKIISEEGTKNYNPRWSPVGNKIVYFKEKGDNRDQIYITDDNGSYHNNITNDTSTHNYYPDWIDANTIYYTQHEGSLMSIRIDGSGKKDMSNSHSNGVRYNFATKQFAYIDDTAGGALTIFSMKKNEEKIVLSAEDLKRYNL